MTLAIAYTPVEYIYDWGEFKCDHASEHLDIREFVGEQFDWTRTCDECGSWFNEVTNEWIGEEL